MSTDNTHKTVGDAICTAWCTKNYGLLRSVLAENLEWYEGPFDEPQRTVEQVVARWKQDLRNQSNIQAQIAGVEILGDISYQRCAAYYESASGPKEMDGIFRIRLDAEGKIVHFEQWWASR